MHMTLTTPALLFPAISLLMLAYTSRFLTLAQLVRELYRRKIDNEEKDSIIFPQIDNLQKRIRLIKSMQICGILSFIFCTLSMFSLFLSRIILGEVLFGVSLLCLLSSLFLSLSELSISTAAINIQLSALDTRNK